VIHGWNDARPAAPQLAGSGPVFSPAAGQVRAVQASLPRGSATADPNGLAESNRRYARYLVSVLAIGVLLAAGLALFVLAGCAVYWTHARASTAQQLALAQRYVEQRRLYEVQMAGRSRPAWRSR
jgi:hypothetical protein